MSTCELKEHSVATLTVTVDGERWTKAQDKAFNKICKDFSVKGFRKGQAPKSMVKRMVNPNAVLYDAVDVLANDLYREAIQEHDLTPVDRPQLSDVPTINETSATVVFNVTVEPIATLGDMSELSYDCTIDAVTDEDMANEIEHIRNRFAEEVDKTDAAQEGDIVNIDYTGTKDGVAFDGGSATGYDLTLGSHSFIPGFEEGVVGMKPEEEKDLQLTFPQDYHVDDLKGAPVVFHVKVNSIRTKNLPEVNDELAQDVLGKDDATVADLNAKVKDQLETSRKNRAESEATEKLMQAFAKTVEVEVPQAMIDNRAAQMVDDYFNRMSYQGIKPADFLRITNQKVEDLVEGYKKDAEQLVKMELGLKALAKRDGLTVDDASVDEEIQRMATAYGMKPEEVKDAVDLEQVKADVLLRKASEALIESCKH